MSDNFLIYLLDYHQKALEVKVWRWVLNIARVLKPFDQSAANWIYAAKNVAWAAPGASQNTGPDPDYLLSDSYPTAKMAMSYSITNLVQDWYLKEVDNNLDLLLFTNQSTSKYFASSENTDSSKRPQLTIKYSCNNLSPDLTPTLAPAQPTNTVAPTPVPSSAACSGAKVAGNVFIDKNANGVYESGESFTANGVVDGSSRFTLIINPGNFTAITYPSWNGWYELPLAQGKYTLNVQLPAGYSLSKPSLFPRSFSICKFNQLINVGVIKNRL